MKNNQQKRKKYTKPEAIKIPVDFRGLVKNVTGGGCPFIFVWDGKKYIKENNILPRSENLDRLDKIVTDFYCFQHTPLPENGELKLRIKEFEQECSWFNKFHLITVEHPANLQIGSTIDGKIVIFNPYKLLLPKSCINSLGEECAEKISNKDWVNNPGNYYDASPGDYLEMDFGKIKSNYLKLIVVDPKNDSFKLAQWDVICRYKCNVCLKIYLAGYNEQISVHHTRVEFYPEIVDLSSYLTKIKGNLRLRFDFIYRRKVAFVGIDTTPPVPMEKKVYQLKQAIHSEFGDVTDILREDNDKFVRLYPGEEIELRFPVPETPKPGNKLSYVLYSKGYYIPTTKILSLTQQEVLRVG